MATFRELHAAARAHQKPKFDVPDLVVNNSRGADAPPTHIPAKAAPTFHALHAAARAHQRSAREVDGPPSMGSAKPVDQVNGRNPFYRPRMIIPAEGPQGEGLLGRMVKGVLVPSARFMVKAGSAFEDNAQRGEVGREWFDRATGRVYVRFSGGRPVPLPKVTDAWRAANNVVDGIGSGLRGIGAGILAATGDTRPLFDAAMSRNTGKHVPTLVQPLVDDAVEYGMDKAYGREDDPLSW